MDHAPYTDHRHPWTHNEVPSQPQKPPKTTVSARFNRIAKQP